MGVAPEPLDGGVVVEGMGSGILEEPVDRRDGPAGCADLIATGLQPEFHRHFLSREQQVVLGLQVARELGPRSVDVTGGLRDANLGEWVVLRLLTGVGGAHALALVFDVCGVGAVCHSHDRRRDGARMDCAPGHLVDRRGVLLQARSLAGTHRPEAEHPVARYEHVLDVDGVGPGALEPDHVPHVADGVVLARDQEAHEVDGFSVLDHRSAEDNPARVARTRGPCPRPVDLVAAVDHLTHTHRGVGRGDTDRGVLAPYVLLRLLREECQVPVVDADDARDPSGGPTRRADPTHCLVERHRIDLVTAPLLGLHELEEPDVLERRDRLVGNLTQILCFLCPLFDLGQQCADLVQYLRALLAAVAHRAIPNSRSTKSSPARLEHVLIYVEYCRFTPIHAVLITSLASTWQVL